MCLFVDGYIVVLLGQGNGCSKTTKTGSNNDDIQLLPILRTFRDTILDGSQKIKAVTWITW